MPGTSFESLKSFFETAPAARRAARPLSRGARVNLALDGGAASFTMESGGPEVRVGPADDPDFTLTLPAGAVSRITGLASDDVAEFGIEFFKLQALQFGNVGRHLHDQRRPRSPRMMGVVVTT